MENWEQKKEVMEKKKNLEKELIIKKDDLTRKEREIQKNLTGIAREERGKRDNKIRVGYEKVYMKQKWYSWNERENKLQERRQRERI